MAARGVQLYCVRSMAAAATAEDAGPVATVLAVACLAALAYAVARVLGGGGRPAPPAGPHKRVVDVVVVTD